jgi:hypothetical protein
MDAHDGVKVEKRVQQLENDLMQEVSEITLGLLMGLTHTVTRPLDLGSCWHLPPSQPSRFSDPRQNLG